MDMEREAAISSNPRVLQQAWNKRSRQRSFAEEQRLGERSEGQRSQY